MTATTVMRPMIEGIAGVEAHLCFEIRHHRPIVIWLDHFTNHEAGGWCHDFAIMTGRIDSKMTEVVQNDKGTRRLVTNDSKHVIVVRNECRGLNDPITKTIMAVYYRPGLTSAELEELELRIRNEQN